MCTKEVSLDPPYYGIAGKWYCSADCAKRGELVRLRAEYEAELKASGLTR